MTKRTDKLILRLLLIIIDTCCATKNLSKREREAIRKARKAVKS